MLIPILLYLIHFCPANAIESFHGGVSYTRSQIKYKEPGVMSEEGVLSGPVLDLRVDPVPGIQLEAQGKWLSGNLEYDGSTFSGTPIKQTTDDVIKEYRFLTGVHWEDLVAYIGYGYRYWRNDLVISYVRDTTYRYMPIGVRYLFRPFFIALEYRHWLEGKNKSFMADTGGGRHDVSFKQKTGKGYSVELGGLLRLEPVDLKLSLLYESWDVAKSTTSNDGVDNLIEPKNQTQATSINLGVFF